jgi:hypothetical protein
VHKYGHDGCLAAEDSPCGRAILTFEPFFSGSIGRPWGKLELQFLVPIVAASPDATYTQPAGGAIEPDETWTPRLVRTASPRFSIGLRADLDELWRHRPAAAPRR